MMFLTILLASWLHPFHISVTNIYYKEKERVMQVEQRIFLDDLEEALQDYSENQKLDIIEDDQKEITEMIKKYLAENFSVVINGKPVKLTFLGIEKELDQNVMWCYYEAEKVKKFDSFRVMNSVLTEKFPDQENIVHYDPKGKTISDRTGVRKIWVGFEIEN